MDASHASHKSFLDGKLKTENIENNMAGGLKVGYHFECLLDFTFPLFELTHYCLTACS